MALAAAAYDRDTALGEDVSLVLRDAMFEQGRDIASPEVLLDIAQGAHLAQPVIGMHDRVLADWAEGRDRNVVGSPHFFVRDEGFFCPSLDIERVAGHLRIRVDHDRLETFLGRCFAA